MSYEKVKSLLNRGLSRPTLYKLVISPSVNNSQFSSKAVEYLEFMATSISVPEIAVEAIPVAGQDMVGVMRQQAAQVTYGKPLTVQVIERSDYIVYKEIKKWFDHIANGSNSINEESHRMKYYDDVICDIQLLKYEYSQHATTNTDFKFAIASKLKDEGHLNDQGYRVAMKVNFKNAYPVNIGDISFNSEAVNQMVRYPFSFTYETYNTVVNDFYSAEHTMDYQRVAGLF